MSGPRRRRPVDDGPQPEEAHAQRPRRERPAPSAGRPARTSRPGPQTRVDLEAREAGRNRRQPAETDQHPRVPDSRDQRGGPRSRQDDQRGGARGAGESRRPRSGPAKQSWSADAGEDERRGGARGAPPSRQRGGRDEARRADRYAQERVSDALEQRRPAGQEPDGRASRAALRCEAHVAGGLEGIAGEELTRRHGKRVRLLRTPRPEILDFDYVGDARDLLAVRTILEISLVRHFDVPRPRGLLGDQHFRALLETIETVRSLLPDDAYTTLHVSAAGSETAVLTRLKEDLSLRTGLAVGPEEGDLLVRLRRPLDGRPGWEALVRISPRPLATRPWRVCNMEGALNATVAHAMVLFSRPRPSDFFLNLACGSGTLLLERLTAAPARRVAGCDISAEALRCAAANVEAAGQRVPVELHPWDATALPLDDSCVNALVADLPFGHLVGTHAQNLELYPALLREAGRVAAPGARFVVISQEVRLMESLLSEQSAWEVEQILRVTLGGLHPRIFVLKRA